jgi:predicted nucleic acid-binding protein
LISTLKKKTNATAIQRTNRFGLNATDRDRNRHRGRYRHRSRHRVGLWDPLILHTNSSQGKNAPQILDSNSRQKKILVIESTVTKVRFNDESPMF